MKALNSSFLAELATLLLTEGPHSDLSQIHSFDDGGSSVCAGYDPNRSTRGPKRERRNVRESENREHCCEDLTATAKPMVRQRAQHPFVEL